MLAVHLEGGASCSRSEEDRWLQGIGGGAEGLPPTGGGKSSVIKPGDTVLALVCALPTCTSSHRKPEQTGKYPPPTGLAVHNNFFLKAHS